MLKINRKKDIKRGGSAVFTSAELEKIQPRSQGSLSCLEKEKRANPEMRLEKMAESFKPYTKTKKRSNCVNNSKNREKYH